MLSMLMVGEGGDPGGVMDDMGRVMVEGEVGEVGTEVEMEIEVILKVRGEDGGDCR